MRGIVEELANGVVVHQATDGEGDRHNIYCEYPWCPPSAACFVYARPAPGGGVNDTEYVACAFGAWEERVIGRGGPATMANGGKFYYSRYAEDGRRDLLCVDLDTFEQRPIPLPEAVPAHARLDIAPGERYLAYNLSLSYTPQLFAIGLADLHTGRCQIIHTDPCICNTHHQFEPGAGKWLMIQHNRGCRFRPDGTRERLVGSEGATLFLLSVPDGKVERLAVGPPHTVSISGHETWIGATGELLLTLNVDDDYDFGKGPIVAVRPGATAREIGAPCQLNHIGIEPSGRVFCGDACQPDQIVIGSPITGRTAFVCPARASYLRARRRNAHYDSHPHAYISPDCRWVVFNSDRTGVQQVYCAQVPAEMVASLGDGSGQPPSSLKPAL